MIDKITVDGRSLRARDKRKARKAEILLAAQKVISDRGYQSTSIAHVLEEAAISRGTFYLYFDSREALFRELVDGFITQLKNCIRPVAIEAGNPIEDIRGNMRRVVDLLFDNRELTTILLREAVAQDALVDEKLNHLYGFLLHMTRQALKNGSQWGLLRPVNEGVVAMAIVGCIKEVLYHYLVANHGQTPDRETIVGELLAFGLKGLTAK